MNIPKDKDKNLIVYKKGITENGTHVVIALELFPESKVSFTLLENEYETKYKADKVNVVDIIDKNEKHYKVAYSWTNEYAKLKYEVDTTILDNHGIYFTKKYDVACYGAFGHLLNEYTLDKPEQNFKVCPDGHKTNVFKSEPRCLNYGCKWLYYTSWVKSAN